MGGGVIEEGGQGGLTCGRRAFLPVRVLLLLLAVTIGMCPLHVLLLFLLLVLVPVVVVVVVVAVGAVADGAVPGHDLCSVLLRGWGGEARQAERIRDLWDGRVDEERSETNE